MFSKENGINSFKDLFQEIKKYLELQKDYAQLHLIEKLTRLFSVIMLVFLLVSLAMIALFYLMFTLVYLLNSWIDSLALCFGIVTLTVLIIATLIFVLRKTLIEQPIVKYLANLIINPTKGES